MNSKHLVALIDHGAVLSPYVQMLKRLRDEYLPVRQALAKEAVARDPYAGISFPGLLDRAPIRWNPPARKTKEIPDEALPLSVSLPIGEPNEAGDYLVDAKRLSRRIAPGLIHGVDDYYSALIVTKLYNEEGIKVIISVYDGWLVPRDAEPVLRDVIKTVGEPWLRGLGPFDHLYELPR